MAIFVRFFFSFLCSNWGWGVRPRRLSRVQNWPDCEFVFFLSANFEIVLLLLLSSLLGCGLWWLSSGTRRIRLALTKRTDLNSVCRLLGAMMQAMRLPVVQQTSKRSTIFVLFLRASVDANDLIKAINSKCLVAIGWRTSQQQHPRTFTCNLACSGEQLLQTQCAYGNKSNSNK